MEKLIDLSLKKYIEAIIENFPGSKFANYITKCISEYYFNQEYYLVLPMAGSLRFFKGTREQIREKFIKACIKYGAEYCTPRIVEEFCLDKVELDWSSLINVIARSDKLFSENFQIRINIVTQVHIMDEGKFLKYIVGKEIKEWILD